VQLFRNVVPEIRAEEVPMPSLWPSKSYHSC